jgi:hypothetical protein
MTPLMDENFTFLGEGGKPEMERRKRRRAEVRSQSLLNPPADLKREISSFVTAPIFPFSKPRQVSR